MNGEKQDRGRWLRVGLLTFTIAGPIVNTLLERMRERVQALQKQAGEAQETVRSVSATALDRLDDLTLAGRLRAAKQARQVEKQAQQLKFQARRLRKTMRNEVQQRRKLDKMVKQLREAGVDWSQELLKRGEDLSEGLAAQGSRISRDLVERSSQVTHDLSERGSQVMQGLARQGSEFSRNLAERSGQVTQDLRKRGSKVTGDLAERGEQLLHPASRRKSTLWTIFGFSLGLAAATVVTYFFIRKRIAGQETEGTQHIELPQEREWNVVSKGRPAGEILHLDSDGTAVATLQAVAADAEQVEAPADAVFVGVVSTKYYYPVDVPLVRLPLSDDKTNELVYFVSEEEAKAQGFTAAE